MEIENDRDLVALASRGCANSFEQLVREYQLPLRAFLIGKVGDRAVADDLAQEVFLVAFRRIGDVNQLASFRSWLFSIARNKAVDHVRARVKAKECASGSLEHLLAVPQSNLFTDNACLLETLKKCMKKLNPAAQSLVQSFYFESRTSEEIAAIRNSKSSAVRMSLMRIRKSLAKCIQLNSGEVNE